MRKLLFFAVLISSCTAKFTPTEGSVAIKRETRKMLDSKVNKMAGVTTNNLTYYFIMNENNTFAAVVNMNDSKQYDFCAGTFEYNADTLNLNYYKNYKSKYLTDRVVVDDFNKEMVFINDDSTKNTKIKILNVL
jgi:hypothetical protein